MSQQRFPTGGGDRSVTPQEDDATINNLTATHSVYLSTPRDVATWVDILTNRPPLSQFEASNSMRRGYGFKRGPSDRDFMNWNKRFFVLQRPFLLYFGEDKSSATCLGTVYVNGATISRVIKYRDSSRKNVVIIKPLVRRNLRHESKTSDENNFYVNFEDKTDADHWIRLLNEAAKEVQVPRNMAAELPLLVTTSCQTDVEPSAMLSPNAAAAVVAAGATVAAAGMVASATTTAALAAVAPTIMETVRDVTNARSAVADEDRPVLVVHDAQEAEPVSNLTRPGPGEPVDEEQPSTAHVADRSAPAANNEVTTSSEENKRTVRSIMNDLDSSVGSMTEEQMAARDIGVPSSGASPKNQTQTAAAVSERVNADDDNGSDDGNASIHGAEWDQEGQPPNGGGGVTPGVKPFTSRPPGQPASPSAEGEAKTPGPSGVDSKTTQEAADHEDSLEVAGPTNTAAKSGEVKKLNDALSEATRSNEQFQEELVAARSQLEQVRAAVGLASTLDDSDAEGEDGGRAFNHRSVASRVAALREELAKTRDELQAVAEQKDALETDADVLSAILCAPGGGNKSTDSLQEMGDPVDIVSLVRGLKQEVATLRAQEKASEAVLEVALEEVMESCETWGRAEIEEAAHSTLAVLMELSQESMAIVTKATEERPGTPESVESSASLPPEAQSNTSRRGSAPATPHMRQDGESPRQEVPPSPPHSTAEEKDTLLSAAFSKLQEASVELFAMQQEFIRSELHLEEEREVNTLILEFSQGHVDACGAAEIQEKRQFADQLEEKASEVEALKERLQTNDEVIAQHLSEIDKLKADAETGKEAMSEKDAACDELKQALTAAEVRVEEAQREADEARQSLDSQKTQLAEQLSTTTGLDEKLAELRSEADRLITELTAEQDRRRSSEDNERDLRDQCTRLEAKVSEASAAAASQVTDVSTQLETALEGRREAEASSAELQKSLEAQQTQLTELATQNEAVKAQLEAAEEGRREAEAAVADLQKSLEATQTQLAELATQNADVQTQLDSAAEGRREAEASAAELKQALEVQRTEHEQSAAQQADVEQQLESAQEGQRETEARVEETIVAMQSTEAERDKLREQLADIEAKASAREEELADARSKLNAAETSCSEKESQIATLEQQIEKLNSDLAVASEAQRTSNSEVEAVAQALKAAETATEGHESRAVELEQSVAELQEKLKKTEASLQFANDEVQHSHRRHEHLIDEAESRRVIVEAAMEDLTALANEHIVASVAQSCEVLGELGTLRVVVAEGKEAAAERDETTTALQQAHDELKQALAAAEVRIEEAQREAKETKQSLDTQKSQLTEQSTRTVDTERRLQTVIEGRREAEASSAELQKSLEAQQTQLTELATQNEAVKAQLEAAEEGRREAEAAVADLQKSLEATQTQLAELATQNADVQTQLESALEGRSEAEASAAELKQALEVQRAEHELQVSQTREVGTLLESAQEEQREAQASAVELKESLEAQQTELSKLAAQKADIQVQLETAVAAQRKTEARAEEAAAALQASQAEQQQLRDQVEDIEAKAGVDGGDAAAKLSTIQTKLNAAETTCNEKDIQIKTLGQQIEKLKSDLDDASEAQRTSNSEAEAVGATLAELRAERDSVAQKYAAEEEDHKATAASLVALEAEITSVRESLSCAEQHQAEAEAAIHTMKASAVQGECWVDSFIAFAHLLLSERAELMDLVSIRCTASETSRRKLSDELASSRAAATEADAKYEKAERQVGALQANIEELKEQLENDPAGNHQEERRSSLPFSSPSTTACNASILSCDSADLPPPSDGRRQTLPAVPSLVLPKHAHETGDLPTVEVEDVLTEGDDDAASLCSRSDAAAVPNKGASPLPLELMAIKGTAAKEEPTQKFVAPEPTKLDKKYQNLAWLVATRGSLVDALGDHYKIVFDEFATLRDAREHIQRLVVDYLSPVEKLHIGLPHKLAHREPRGFNRRDVATEKELMRLLTIGASAASKPKVSSDCDSMDISGCVSPREEPPLGARSISMSASMTIRESRPSFARTPRTPRAGGVKNASILGPQSPSSQQAPPLVQEASTRESSFMNTLTSRVSNASLALRPAANTARSRAPSGVAPASPK